MYLTYDEFKTYGGTLSETDFPVAEMKARKLIDEWTGGRVQNMKSVPEAVKLCMMSIIRFDAKYGADAMTDQAVVASFSTDGYSESYGAAGDQVATVRESLRRTAWSLLYGETDDDGIPLLYRGIQT